MLEVTDDQLIRTETLNLKNGFKRIRKKKENNLYSSKLQKISEEKKSELKHLQFRATQFNHYRNV